MPETNNEKEMKEMKANLFGAYELGSDPWACGGYYTSEPAPEPEPEPEPEPIPTPGPAPVPVTEPAKALAREAVQQSLDLFRVRKVLQKDNKEAEYSILDGVVWAIREALRKEGIEVTCLETTADFQHRPRMTHCDFQLSEIGKRGFKSIIARRFVDEFLKNNPQRAHMFCTRVPLPNCVQVARHFFHDGLVLRGVGDYFIGTDSHMVRVDCIYAIATEENLLLCPTTHIGAGLTHPG